MNIETIKKHFPNASAAFVRANLSPGDPRTVANKPTCVESIKNLNSGVQTTLKKRSDFGTKRPRHFNTCKLCGKEFNAPHSFKRKYCSLDCAYKSPERCSHIKPKDRGVRVCVYCGKEFKVHTSAAKAVHCSRQCSGAEIGKRSMLLNRRIVPRTHVIKKNCKTCGVEFESPQSNKRVFCSTKCAGMNVELKTKRVATFNSTPKPNNYSRTKKGWANIGGKKFFSRSSWESNYARYLQFQKEQGLILDWEHEPVTFWFKGIKRGVCSFLPDFKVTTKSGVEYHEVKAWMDARSVTKIKRMAKYHPSIKLIVIDQVRYRSIAKTAASFIPGWTTARGSR